MATGNLGTIQCQTANPIYIASVTVGGTATPVWSATGYGIVATGYSETAEILSTTSTAGPIVINFSASAGAGATCVIREYSVSAGTPKLDWAKGASPTFSSVTSVPGLTPVFSGSNDVGVQMGNTSVVAISGVTGTGWANGKFDATDFPGWADKQNSINTTPPGWTITPSSSGTISISGMDFATDATACSDVALMDSTAGTNAANVSAANLNSSTFGSPGTWGAGGGTVAGAVTWATAAQHNLLTTTSNCSDHKTGAGTLGVKIDASVATSGYFKHSWTGFNDSFSCSYWYVPHVVTSDPQFYALSACWVENNLGSDFVSTMTAAGNIYLETSANANGNPNIGTKFGFTQDVLYRIKVQFNKYTSAPVSLTSVANASGGNTVYTGTITGGGSNAFAGRTFMAYGFAQAANNGVFTVTASTTTTLTLANASGVTDTTGSATPSFHLLKICDSSGTLLSTQGKLASATTPAQPSNVNIGKGGDDVSAAGIFGYVSNPIYDFSGNFSGANCQ